jgi:DNA-binding GntR family transcriptional regulator
VYTGSHTTDGVLRSDRAYADLKRRLLVGDFGLNVRLGEERLAAELGVSRTPVREALLRLHAEGLVRRAPDGGYLALAPDVEGMRHLYEVRIALELQALHRPGRIGSVHDAVLLAALRDEWRALADEDQEPNPGFVLVDESFHLALAESAGNPVLVDLLRQLNERIRVVRMQDFLTVERIEQTIVEHLGIVDAVLDGDLVVAEQRFDAHVAQSLAVVEQRVLLALARMAADTR